MMLSRTIRFIITPLLLAAFLIGGTTGIALADNEAGGGNRTSFFEAVADYLGITAEQLREVYKEARSAMDPENPDYEAFKAEVEDILNEQYGIEYGALQEAIDEAKAQLRENIEARKAEWQEKQEALRAEWQERHRARIAALQEKLGDRWETIQEKLQNRQQNMQELRERWQEHHNQNTDNEGLPGPFGPGKHPPGGNKNGNGTSE
jgi:hypothetical protein